MGKKSLILLTQILLFLVIICIVPTSKGGGQAGVGVLNVPPKFTFTKITPHDNSIRIYLTVSDYNSWSDIYNVSIILEDNGFEKAVFSYKQYENTESHFRINTFVQLIGGEDLLVEEKCSYAHSSNEETVDDKCNLQLLFVFKNTFFSRLSIIVGDMGGLTATTQVDYDTLDFTRDDNIIIIPWINGQTIRIGFPSYLLEIFCVIIALLGTLYLNKEKITLIKVNNSV